MINELTSDQVQKMPEYVAKYLAIGLSTQPVDPEAATLYGKRLMNFLGREHIATILLPSPFQAMIAANMLGNCQQVEQQDMAYRWPYLEGSYWSAYISYLKFMQNELGVNLADFSIISDQLQFGPTWPLNNIVIISDTPSIINIENGRLHCDHGPSILYRDGFSVWSINGIQVNEQIVLHPKSQIISQIDNEENEEVKRIRIERFGWQEYLIQKNAKVLDHRYNEIEGTEESLMACNNMKILVCACPSTRRIYAIETDPACNTCEQAQIYLGGKKSRRNVIGAS